MITFRMPNWFSLLRESWTFCNNLLWKKYRCVTFYLGDILLWELSIFLWFFNEIYKYLLFHTENVFEGLNFQTLVVFNFWMWYGEMNCDNWYNNLKMSIDVSNILGKIFECKWLFSCFLTNCSIVREYFWRWEFLKFHTCFFMIHTLLSVARRYFFQIFFGIAFICCTSC